MEKFDIFEDMEQTVELFRRMVREIPDKYVENERSINKLQSEMQDLLHLTEFMKFNASQGYKISSEIKRCRTERRKLKNENETLRPMVEYFKKYDRSNLPVIDQVISKTKNAKSNQEVKGYGCRVREDLQENFNSKKIINL